MSDTSIGHCSVPWTVKVKVTAPEAPEFGNITGWSVFCEPELIVAGPAIVHLKVAPNGTLAPEIVWLAVSQILASKPALTIGLGIIVTATSEKAFVQAAFKVVAVSFKITVPDWLASGV